MIKIISKLSFLVIGFAHFLINYIFFNVNFILGNHVWLVNNNSIGEANLEAILLTLSMPFFLYGFFLFIIDFRNEIYKYIQCGDRGKNVQ